MGYVAMEGALDYYRPSFAGRDITSHLIGDDEPIVKVLAPKSGRIAAAIVSTGALNLVGVICARLAIILSQCAQFEFPFNELLQNDVDGVEPLVPGSFAMAGEYATNTTIYREDPKTLFRGLSRQQTQSALEIYSAAMEFIVLHETAHVVNFHRRVVSYYRMLWSTAAGLVRDGRLSSDAFKLQDSELQLAMLLEHHADYFAMSQMLRGAPVRPLIAEFGLALSKTVYSDHYSRRLIGILGAAVGMGFTLLSESPWVAERINPSLKGRGHHPSPLTRLFVGMAALASQTASIRGRMYYWPQRTLKQVPLILQVAEMRSTFGVISALHDDWGRSNVFSHPAKDWPDWLQHIFETRNNTLRDDRWKGVHQELAEIDEHARRFRSEA